MSSETRPASTAAQSTSAPGGQPASVSGELDSAALREAAVLRADTYRILARVFRAPPDRFILDLLASRGDADDPASRLARAWAALAGASRTADPASLDDEYHALFIGLGRGEVLPYASWYLSGFLLDKPLAHLRAELSELGIERAESVSESEDHVAALCETMALLVDVDEGIDHAGQKRFFERHVQPWFPRFLDDLRGAKSADFYRRIADLGQGFIEFEESWLSLPR